MSVILILIVLSLLLASGFLACFVWAVGSGQYEDPGTPALRILLDDRNPSSPNPPPSTNTPLTEK